MITNDGMDAVFNALAHATRRRILDLVRDSPGITVGALAANFDVSRIAVMNHLAVLSEAGLVISKKSGRTRTLFLNATPIREMQLRWLDSYSAVWTDRVLDLKHAAEAAHAAKDTET